jgi:peptidoglycan-associated lipoprotein
MLMVCVALVFFNSCKKKVATVPDEHKPTVEDVGEKPTAVERPQLTEAEMIQRQTLEEVNKQGYLKKIHFDFDKYFIRDDMKSILERNAEWLLKYPNVEISIEGHCDERGTVEYNMALGEKRAYTARKYLENLGVPIEKMRIVSYGKSKPLVKGVDEASHFKNRRDEFIITKK